MSFQSSIKLCVVTWAALRSRTVSLSSSLPSNSSSAAIPQWKLGFNSGLCSLKNNNISEGGQGGSLNLAEVEKILSDVRADDVKVVPVRNTSFADFVVLATGRSAWHVRNIAQALLYKVKEKQRGAKRMLMPSVEGQAGGKWIVVDCGSLIIHALDEKMRTYFNLEALWTKEESTTEDSQDVEKGLVKVRRKNNSKKRPAKSA